MLVKVKLRPGMQTGNSSAAKAREENVIRKHSLLCTHSIVLFHGKKLPDLPAGVIVADCASLSPQSTECISPNHCALDPVP